MSEHCTFQAEIRWECVKDIVDIVRNGGMTDPIARGNLIKHTCCFIGCAAEWVQEQKNDDWLFGDSQTQYTMAAARSLEMPELITQIEQQIERANEATPQAIPWQAILKVIIPLLLELLQRLQ